MKYIIKLIKTALLLISFLVFPSAFSQENFIPGYVIKNNDTIRGLVDYRNWEKNPNEIRFKSNTESNATSYSPSDISEFGVNDEIYVSGTIDAEISSTQSNRIEEGSQVNTRVVTIFLQTLVRGEKSLYYYNNAYGRENFYIKKADDYELLVYKRYSERLDGKRVIRENKTYLGQLNLYLNDCESIYSKLENVSYKLKSLTQLFEYYYSCTPNDISYQKEKDNITTDFGIVAGASMTSLGFRSETHSYLTDAEFTTSYNFAAGLFLDVILARNLGKWSLYNELLYSSYRNEGYYEDFENERNFIITTTDFGYSYLKVNNMVRYKYPVGGVFLLFNGGMSNGIAISETNNKRRERTFYATETVDEDAAIASTRKYEQGLLLGTGLQYNKFSLEIRYERGNGVSELRYLTSVTERYFMLLGYRF